MKRDFVWDGEKIKQITQVEDKKHTPKDILDSLDHVRGEIVKLEDGLTQFEQQIKLSEANLKSAKEFEKQLESLEKKCEEIQLAHIKKIIAKIHSECVEKAKIEAEKELKTAPDAYTESHQKKLPYLKYQKLLATNEKMAEKISKRMIRIHLYENPVFSNPFEG